MVGFVLQLSLSHTHIRLTHTKYQSYKLLKMRTSFVNVDNAKVRPVTVRKYKLLITLYSIFQISFVDNGQFY